jgi:hypothetical protein
MRPEDRLPGSEPLSTAYSLGDAGIIPKECRSPRASGYDRRHRMPRDQQQRHRRPNTNGQVSPNRWVQVAEFDPGGGGREVPIYFVLSCVGLALPSAKFGVQVADSDQQTTTTRRGKLVGRRRGDRERQDSRTLLGWDAFIRVVAVGRSLEFEPVQVKRGLPARAGMAAIASAGVRRA